MFVGMECMNANELTDWRIYEIIDLVTGIFIVQVLDLSHQKFKQFKASLVLEMSVFSLKLFLQYLTPRNLIKFIFGFGRISSGICCFWRISISINSFRRILSITIGRWISFSIICFWNNFILGVKHVYCFSSQYFQYSGTSKYFA